VREILPKDIRLATERMRELQIADDAINVAYTENMVGVASLEATRDGPSFTS
jgi:hypothetical protein